MANNKRCGRVADQIQRELSVILQHGMDDPRLGLTTVCAVRISSDLSVATVFVTFMGSKLSMNECVAILNHANAYIRTLLAKQVNLRCVPNLKFVYDDVMDRGNHLASLLNNL